MSNSPDHIFILTRNGSIAAKKLAALLTQFGQVSLIVDEAMPNPFGESATINAIAQNTEIDCVWIPDEWLTGFEHTTSSLIPKCYTAWGRALYYALQLAQGSAAQPNFWFIEEDVALQPEHFCALQTYTTASHADFAARTILSREVDPHWWHWQFMTEAHIKPMHSLNCMCRLSSKFLTHLADYIAHAKSLGFHEITLPSIAAANHLHLLDWQTETACNHCFGTFHYRPIITQKQWGICHPVKDAQLHAAICDMQRSELTNLAFAPRIFQPKPTRAPSTPPKIVIGVCSCQKNADKRTACRNTWAQPALLAPNIQVLYFMGGADPLYCEQDTVVLAADDSYMLLPQKVMAFFRYALENIEFDWLFKCDDDTYVDTQRLLTLATPDYNFVGSNMLATRGSPSGGAGYLLSRELLQALVSHASVPDFGFEDVLIGEAAVQLGARTFATDRLKPTARVYPRADNDVITAHYCDPVRMNAVHTVRYASPIQEIQVRHPYWQDTLKIFHDGTFARTRSTCAGQFIEDSHGATLHWFDWDAERLFASDTDADCFVVGCKEVIMS